MVIVTVGLGCSIFRIIAIFTAMGNFGAKSTGDGISTVAITLIQKAM